MAITARNMRQMLDAAPSAAWQPRVLEDLAEPCRWLFVFALSAAGHAEHRYGLTADGTWTSEYADRKRIMPANAIVAFFPLLEGRWQDAVALVIRGLAGLNISTRAALTFPIDEIVIAALRSTAHWKALAVAWIDAGFPLNDVMASLVPTHPRSLDRERARLLAIFGIQ